MNRIRKIAKRLPYPIKILIKSFLFPGYYFRYFSNDLMALLGYKFGKSDVIFIAGYPKSGTTWVENFISNIPGYNPRVLHGDLENMRNHNLPSNAFKYFPKYGYSSVKTHINPTDANIKVLRDRGVKKIVVMYRDPRDIVVSNYYHVLKSNPWKKTDSFYLDYKKVSKEEAMLHSLNMVSEDFQQWLYGWEDKCLEVSDIECYFLRYEDILKDSKLKFREILNFYEINLNSTGLNKIVSKITLKRKSFKPEEGNIGNRSTLRNGISKSWKYEMNSKVKLISSEKLKHIIKHLEY
jgi:hypothetical protein